MGSVLFTLPPQILLVNYLYTAILMLHQSIHGILAHNPNGHSLLLLGRGIRSVHTWISEITHTVIPNFLIRS